MALQPWDAWLGKIDRGLLRDQPGQPYSYLVFKGDDGAVFVKNGLTGRVVFSSPDASAAIQYAIDALPTGGGKIIIKHGKYILSRPVSIDKSGVHITGESAGGDLFFTNDDTYHGVSNKIATVIIAENIDGFKIGFNAFVFGITIENLLIRGVQDEGVIPITTYTSGAGIFIARGDTIQLRNIQVERKEYGIRLDTTVLGAFAYDKVIDTLIAENLLFSYNVFGIFQRGWLTVSRLRNIFGYYNQKSLLFLDTPGYDIVVENVWSNADSWNTLAGYEAPIAVNRANQDVKLINVSVYGGHGTNVLQVPLMHLCPNAYVEGGQESFRGHIVIINPVLFETDSDAIRIPPGCKGIIEIYNPHIGSTGPYGYAGGVGRIRGSAVMNQSPGDVVVKVRGGFVNTQEALWAWFYNVPYENIQDVENYRTRNSGVATIPAGSTRVSVSHGLVPAAPPRKVLVTPYGNVRVWVENITTTSFDIVTDTAPTADLQIAWYAEL